MEPKDQLTVVEVANYSSTNSAEMTKKQAYHLHILSTKKGFNHGYGLRGGAHSTDFMHFTSWKSLETAEQSQEFLYESDNHKDFVETINRGTLKTNLYNAQVPTDIEKLAHELPLGAFCQRFSYHAPEVKIDGERYLLMADLLPTANGYLGGIHLDSLEDSDGRIDLLFWENEGFSKAFWATALQNPRISQWRSAAIPSMRSWIVDNAA